MEVLQKIQEDVRLHRSPVFYVKCTSTEVAPDGSSRVTFIGVSRTMSSGHATVTWPAALAIEAIEKYGIRFRCPDRQGRMFVELVSARDARGAAYIKTVVDRDEPLTLLMIRERNIDTENYIVSRIIDALE